MLQPVPNVTEQDETFATISVPEDDLASVLDEIDDEAVAAVVGEGQRTTVESAEDYFSLLDEGVRVRFPNPNVRGADLKFSVWVKATLTSQDKARALIVGYKKRHNIKDEATIPSTVFADAMARAWFDGDAILKWDFPLEFNRGNFISVIKRSPKMLAVLANVFQGLTDGKEKEAEEAKGN